MSDLVEGIKLFGGIAGLATAAFTIHDRLIKNRPVASITAFANPYTDDGDAALKLINRSEREIVVLAIAAGPDRTAPLIHDDILSMVEREMGIESARLLAPGETAIFPIHLNDEDRIKLQHSIEVLHFKIRWCRAGGLPWWQGFPLSVAIRGRDLHQLLVDAHRRGVPSPTAVAGPRTI